MGKCKNSKKQTKAHNKKTSKSKQFTLQVNNKNITVTGITVDSRKVEPGFVFIAYKGVNLDSHNFIKQAISSGAKYIIGEKDFKQIQDQIPASFPKQNYIQVKNARQTWALLEAQRYNNPEKKLKIIGITGTDGKTTTTHLLYHILKNAGKKVGILSTTVAIIDGKEFDTGAHVTTPPPDIIFRVLKQMLDKNIEYVILETSSHGLLHDRVFGIPYIAVGVTNITHEHFDIHKTYKKLLKDKSKIFKQTNNIFMVPKAPGINDILKLVPKNKIVMLLDPDKIFTKETITQLNDFKLKFPGIYNIYNATLAYGISSFLGISHDQILKGLAKAKPPEGRFQKLENNLNKHIVIDFAHTPNAFKNLLTALHEFKEKNSKIVMVFGAAGKRDVSKRPEMGKIASELAHNVVITSEDPRGEDPIDIAKDIIKEAREFPFIIITDRKKAIEIGIKIANPGDWVLILGKAHESSMNFDGKNEVPWSDIKFTKQIIKKLEQEKQK